MQNLMGSDREYPLNILALSISEFPDKTTFAANSVSMASVS